MRTSVVMCLSVLLASVVLIGPCRWTPQPPFDGDLLALAKPSETPDPGVVRDLLLRQKTLGPAWKVGRHHFGEYLAVDRESHRIVRLRLDAEDGADEVEVPSRPFVAFVCDEDEIVYTMPGPEILRRSIVVVSTDDDLMIGHVHLGFTVRIER